MYIKIYIIEHHHNKPIILIKKIEIIINWMITSEISVRIYFLVMNNHNFIYDGSELLGFGDNQDGQLGLGDNKNINLPTLVMTDTTIRQIVCGYRHTFIFKKSGELFAFVYNDDGQLGLGDNNNRNTPTLLGTFDNIVSINGVILQIKWNPDIYVTLSKTKKREIKNFL